MGIAAPRADTSLPLDSFMDKVAVSDEGCWEWTAAKVRGYGMFRKWRAHRAAWLLFKGEDPGERHVCHACDNPSCVNPEHLFLGDPKINALDRQRKGRGNNMHGEGHVFSKLTNQKVAEIRTLLATGDLSQAEIARIYEISPSSISRIARGEHWRSESDGR